MSTREKKLSLSERKKIDHSLKKNNYGSAGLVLHSSNSTRRKKDSGEKKKKLTSKKKSVSITT